MKKHIQTSETKVWFVSCAAQSVASETLLIMSGIEDFFFLNLKPDI